MKRIFTSFIALAIVALPLLAQDVDESFVFVDEEYEVIENGSTIVRNLVELNDAGVEIINSGILVMNDYASYTDYIKMKYVISKIDNGSFQLCFPSTCNYKDAAGSYVTDPGQLMEDVQDLLCEWFPAGDGECVVTLSIEILTKNSGFPVTYEHKADGPSITIRFVKGDIPGPEPIVGDVNGDGEIGISDVNAVIDMIQSGADYSAAADVNGDGEIGISDVNALIDMILGS